MRATTARTPRETHFDNARFARAGVESMSLSELRRRVAPGRLALPERVDFHMLMRVSRGVGTHTVDFVDCAMAPGALVFVRPGQVQQWRLDDSLEGEIVLITPAALDVRASSRDAALLDLDEWPAVMMPRGEAASAIAAEMQRLRKDLDCFDDTALDIALVHHSLLALLLRLARWRASLGVSAAESGAEQKVYRRFRRELEKRFRERLGVRTYAERLGYSESSLSRACRAAEGRSAKLVIDRRVALEAQRMLVHGEASVASIGYALGFSEPTNFVKFFSRMAGTTPAGFRRRMRSGDSR